MTTGHSHIHVHVAGPPRQATGPPLSGAGVEVGMLRVLGVPLLENLWISMTYQDSTIAKLFFRKTLRESDGFGPKKVQTYSTSNPCFCQKIVLI